MTNSPKPGAAEGRTELLAAPCIFCNYNGEGYYQANTHNPGCPWWSVGGALARERSLRGAMQHVYEGNKQVWRKLRIAGDRIAELESLFEGARHAQKENFDRAEKAEAELSALTAENAALKARAEDAERMYQLVASDRTKELVAAAEAELVKYKREVDDLRAEVDRAIQDGIDDTEEEKSLRLAAEAEREKLNAESIKLRCNLNRIAAQVGHPPIAPGELDVKSVAEAVERRLSHAREREEALDSITPESLEAFAASSAHHDEHHRRERGLLEVNAALIKACTGFVVWERSSLESGKPRKANLLVRALVDCHKALQLVSENYVLPAAPEAPESEIWQKLREAQGLLTPAQAKERELREALRLYADKSLWVQYERDGAFTMSLFVGNEEGFDDGVLHDGWLIAEAALEGESNGVL